MIISFDLDDTLIPSTKTFPLEKRNLLSKLAGAETLREGTVGLLRHLKSQGHKIYIYTTSFRRPWKVLLTFRAHGVPVDRCINQQQHLKEARKHGLSFSKYPPAFGIDIHIDDSPGVKIEGERYGFRTIVVNDDDQDWVETVKSALNDLGNAGG